MVSLGLSLVSLIKKKSMGFPWFEVDSPKLMADPIRVFLIDHQLTGCWLPGVAAFWPGNQVPEISVHTFQSAFLEPGGVAHHLRGSGWLQEKLCYIGYEPLTMHIHIQRVCILWIPLCTSAQIAPKCNVLNIYCISLFVHLFAKSAKLCRYLPREHPCTNTCQM